MLQIYIYGNKENGWLDVDAKSVLNMEGITDLFDEDLKTGEFSLPVEIPWTDNNKRLLSFAERIENNVFTYPYWKVDVYDEGFPALISAKMIIIEKVGSFSYISGKFNATISGNKGLFGSTIKNKKLKDLYLCGAITWDSSLESRDFATQVMKGELPQYNNIISFAPVAIEDFIDTQRPDYTTEFLVKDTVNYIVCTGSGANDWVFGRPVVTGKDALGNPILANQASLPGADHYSILYTHIDYRTIPFFNLKYVFKKCFEEFGYTVVGDFIDSTDFDNLYLFNNFSLELYSIANYRDFNNKILPANHLPDIKISDFLQAIFQMFNMFPQFDGSTNTVTLKYRKDVIFNKTILPITDKVIDNFDAVIDTENLNKGYSLDYTWDEKDQLHSDLVKEKTLQQDNIYFIGDKSLVATVAKKTDLDSLNIGRQLTTSDCAFVLAEGMYYTVANATTSPILWDAFADSLEPYKNADDTTDINIGAATLCNHIELNLATGLVEKKYYLATRLKGSYVTNGGMRVKNSFGLSIFYISKQTMGTNQIPVSYYHNRNSDNNIIEKYSLALNGTEGLAENFHRKWQDLKTKAITVKTSVIADKKLIEDLKNYNRVEINGTQFLVSKIERNIPQTEAMNIWLVPV